MTIWDRTRDGTHAASYELTEADTIVSDNRGGNESRASLPIRVHYTTVQNSAAIVFQWQQSKA